MADTQRTSALPTPGRLAECPALVDPKGHGFSRYAGATAITPDRAELSQVVGACSDKRAMTPAPDLLSKPLRPDPTLAPDAQRLALLPRPMVFTNGVFVDAVLSFDEATPLALLQACKPEVYVKGGDCDIDTLPEASPVRSWGGRALALPFIDGYSTTGLVARLRATA